MKNDPEEFKGRIASFGIDEAFKGMIEELTQNKQLPAGQEDTSHERLIKLINLIKINPEKMILLHMRPGMFPLHKIWEEGRATLKVQGG